MLDSARSSRIAMDAGYVSAVAALAGSIIGGVTSLTASWLTQHVQLRAQRLVEDLRRREELYKSFIEEASRLFADAYEHNRADVSNLVNLYALVNRMRIVSSPEIVQHADSAARSIIETYQAPNKTLRDVSEILNNTALSPLREFSNACREELQGRR
jgi:hypothetical protein